MRPIARAETSVRVSLRVGGREDFVKEWPVGEPAVKVVQQVLLVVAEDRVLDPAHIVDRDDGGGGGMWKRGIGGCDFSAAATVAAAIERMTAGRQRAERPNMWRESIPRALGQTLA